jgi:threonine dehydrogenase-like Zn-dependent dehydrogenase
MKALRIHGPLEMRIEEIPIPPVDEGQVLVRVDTVGICATDIELYEGRMPYIRQGLTRLPLTPGHEWSGTVERLGDKVQNVKAGDRVVGDISLGCGQCLSCLRGAYHLCERRTELGVIKADGAFAEFLSTLARHVYAIPPGLSMEEAAFAEPAATCLNALRRTGVRPGDRAAVFGDGVIGFLTAQICRCMGAPTVVLIAPTSEHARESEELGITFVDSTKVDISREVPRILDGYPEVVSDCTGNPAALNEALHLTAPGGRLNTVSITGSQSVAVDVDYLVTRDIVMVGSLASPNAFPSALRLLASGALKVRSLISRIFSFGEAFEAFEYVRLRKEPRIKVLVRAQ